MLFINIACDGECQRGYAIELVRHGIRAPIVDVLTDVSNGVSNQLWHDIHARASPSGRHPDSVANCLTSIVLAAEAAAFVSIYNSVDRRKSKYANAPDFIKALSLFRTSLPGATIDCNVLYYTVRDVRSGVVRYSLCSRCNSRYIHCPTRRHTRNCPFCAGVSTSHEPGDAA